MSQVIADHLSIKSWAEDDRPREKLINKGKIALSDAELIAILIGSGSRNESAVELSKRVLKSCNNSLSELGKKSIAELVQHKGIGEAKAISILSALELGRRRKDTEAYARAKISCSRDAFEVFRPYLQDLPHEEFWIITLNRSNQIIKPYKISQGGIASTIADTRLIFLKAVEDKASSIILGHNHPSGNQNPSSEDHNLTRKIKEAGKILDIAVLDHLIFAENSYYSFADENFI
jgi:DNA repair protein RadC